MNINLKPFLKSLTPFVETNKNSFLSFGKFKICLAVFLSTGFHISGSITIDFINF
jgi:hypothetical protein